MRWQHPDIVYLYVGYSLYFKGKVLAFFLGTSGQQCECY
jgi:hypothetical protein